jgi:adenylate kinase
VRSAQDENYTLSARLGRTVSYDEVRADSGTLIGAHDVVAIDRRLLKWVEEHRPRAPCVIDSHAVTREKHGFRTTAFSDGDWKSLRPTSIFSLYASPSVVAARVQQDAAGRRLSDAFHVALHASLQGAVATTYAILLGLPLHSICTDDLPAEQVARMIADSAQLPIVEVAAGSLSP